MRTCRLRVSRAAQVKARSRPHCRQAPRRRCWADPTESQGPSLAVRALCPVKNQTVSVFGPAGPRSQWLTLSSSKSREPTAATGDTYANEHGRVLVKLSLRGRWWPAVSLACLRDEAGPLWNTPCCWPPRVRSQGHELAHMKAPPPWAASGTSPPWRATKAARGRRPFTTFRALLTSKPGTVINSLQKEDKAQAYTWVVCSATCAEGPGRRLSGALA